GLHLLAVVLLLELRQLLFQKRAEEARVDLLLVDAERERQILVVEDLRVVELDVEEIRGRDPAGGEVLLTGELAEGELPDLLQELVAIFLRKVPIDPVEADGHRSLQQSHGYLG